jgi:hypothetical protein
MTRGPADHIFASPAGKPGAAVEGAREGTGARKGKDARITLPVASRMGEEESAELFHRACVDGHLGRQHDGLMAMEGENPRAEGAAGAAHHHLLVGDVRPR